MTNLPFRLLLNICLTVPATIHPATPRLPQLVPAQHHQVSFLLVVDLRQVPSRVHLLHTLLFKTFAKHTTTIQYLP